VFNPEKHVGEEQGLKTSVFPPFAGEEEWTQRFLNATMPSDWDRPPRPIAERLKDGHLLVGETPEEAAEIAEVFCSLTEEEQAKFWANVKHEIEYEEWVSGEREHHPDYSPKKRPTMKPPIYSPTALPLEEALRRLGRVRVRGDEWVAACPVHEDRSPSMVVMEHKDYPGEGFFWCYAGCTHLQIRAKLLAMRADG